MTSPSRGGYLKTIKQHLKPPPSLVSGVFHGLPKWVFFFGRHLPKLNRLPCHPSNQTQQPKNAQLVGGFNPFEKTY